MNELDDDRWWCDELPTERSGQQEIRELIAWVTVLQSIYDYPMTEILKMIPWAKRKLKPKKECPPDLGGTLL